MRYHVLFIQGGGGNEDYQADAKLVASLTEALGSAYSVHYPFLSDDSSPDFGRMKQIGKEISSLKGEIILVGHSLGASMLLKYLSESEVKKNIAGIFLISTPFWSGQEDWKQGLKLHEDFPNMRQKMFLFFYTTAAMTKKYHLHTSRYMHKSCHEQLFVK
jgi:uncharacterized protein